MLQNQNNCHSEPNLQRLTYEESKNSKEILRMQFQRSCSQNDTALVGADSISAKKKQNDQTIVGAHDCAHGITLIALVVTLVVLLILAGITINFALSEGGIIAKAQSAKEKQEIGQLKDQIGVDIADWYADKALYKDITIDNLWDKLVQDKTIADAKTDIEGPDANGVYLVTTNKGYVIEVIVDDNGNVTIGEGGKKDKLPPRIIEFKSTSKTTSSITVKAEVTRIEDGGKLSYYYKKSSEVDYKSLKENTTDKTAEYTNLTQNETYDLKLVATNKNGNVEQKISVITGELASGTISQKGSTTWSAGTASVELQTTDTANTLQYQKNGIIGSWTNYGAAITGLVHGDIVYARMYDGINGSSPFSLNITDDVAPQIASMGLSSSTTEEGTDITATVTQIDNESGVDVNKCKWVYNITSTLIGTDEASYTGGAFSTNPQTISLNATTAGTYYLHVLTIDKAGNKKESISGAVKVEIATPYINDLSNDYLTQNTFAKDTTSKTITIPNGFKVVKSEAILIDKGIVIEDKKGNQFVWVPVPDPSTMYEVQNGQKVGKLYDFSTSGATLKAYPGKNTGYRESDVVTGNATGNGAQYDGDTTNLSILGLSSTAQFATQLQTEFDQMITSVEKYKGFYIGRYSTGNLTANTNTEPVVKKGQTTIKNVNWYYMYQNSKKIASGNSNVVTSMIWGCQYDRTLQWLVESGSKIYAKIVDSRSWGNYADSTGAAATGSGTKQPTGTNEAWKANNIYDIAGNVWKWTSEACNTDNRALRGGGYSVSGSSVPASIRSYGAGPHGTNHDFGSVSTLIIK